MQIGDKYSGGVITNMEQDPTKNFWIEVSFSTGGKSVIRFNGPKDTVDNPGILRGTVKLTGTQYQELNNEFKKLKEENLNLSEENKNLRGIINKLLSDNAKL